LAKPDQGQDEPEDQGLHGGLLSGSVVHDTASLAPILATAGHSGGWHQYP
jgi:hypothetical protein